MCSNESPPPTKESLTVGLNSANPMAGFLPGLEHYRLQLYHYAMAERLRLAQQLHPQHPGIGHTSTGSSATHLTMPSGFSAPLPLYPSAAAAAAAANYPSRLALSMALLHPHHQRIPEEPKPQHSYIGLIAMAILSSPEKKLVLSDIYQHILEHYPYFRSRGPGWRNSIRHNLSLNDCFVKSGRSANGKGHYWAIHPANLEDFRRGDFRRRKAQRKVRRHMGLAVDEEPDSPSPPPLPATPPPSAALVGPPTASQSITAVWSPHDHQRPYSSQSLRHPPDHYPTLRQISQNQMNSNSQCHIQNNSLLGVPYQPSRKRQFDVASLLAPDDQQVNSDEAILTKTRKFSCSEDEHETDNIDNDEEDVDIDVETNPFPTPNTPSGSPDVKMISSGNSCNWNAPNIKTNQPLVTTHLHNHLYIRNHYIQTNTTSSSSI